MDRKCQKCDSKGYTNHHDVISPYDARTKQIARTLCFRCSANDRSCIYCGKPGHRRTITVQSYNHKSTVITYRPYNRDVCDYCNMCLAACDIHKLFNGSDIFRYGVTTLRICTINIYLVRRWAELIGYNVPKEIFGLIYMFIMNTPMDIWTMQCDKCNKNFGKKTMVKNLFDKVYYITYRCSQCVSQYTKV